MGITVHKFGGASLSTAENIKNVASIIASQMTKHAVIVVSAMGKTTNALELVAKAVFDKHAYINELNSVKTYHLNILKQLFTPDNPIFEEVNDILVEIEWIASEENSNYNYVYDQIVSIGELLSSQIMFRYLQTKINIGLLDARDCVFTDQTYRAGKVNWELTKSSIHAKCFQLFEKQEFLITQGFIGVDIENNTTTLGREGSDYTAAIFGVSLDAASVNVWKDVPGIMSADPKRFDFAKKIDELSYIDLFAMADSGAKVIHPKTILPLKSKQIPLNVHSYMHPDITGTSIHAMPHNATTTIVTAKDNQRLIYLAPKDFSVEVSDVDLLQAFTRENVEVNYFQKNAMNYALCVNEEYALSSILNSLESTFEINTHSNLNFFTILNTNSIVVAFVKC